MTYFFISSVSCKSVLCKVVCTDAEKINQWGNMIDDHYNGRIVVFRGGVLDGQATDITDYSGTNGTITMTAVTEAPLNNQAFTIV